MSTSTNPQLSDVNGPPKSDASTPARSTTLPVLTLSSLAAPQMTLKDLGPLIPATVVSLAFNTALVIGILWYQSGSATARELRTVEISQDEETKIEQQQDKEMIDIDIGAAKLDVSPETVEIQIPGEVINDVSTVATPNLPEKPERGSGGDSPSGFAGSGETEGALPGTFLKDSLPGFLGKDGFGPSSEGGGLSGIGGSTMKPGGFGLRDEAGRKDAVRRGGGNDASEQAVARGLIWLANHQAADGRWSLDKYHQHGRNCGCKDMAFEAGIQANDTAATALGLLPFLGAGQTHKKGSFAKNIKAGLFFLMSRQDSKGDLGGGMYSHGLGTLALCEAYALSNDPSLRVAAQRALKFIEYAQDPMYGGWDYSARRGGNNRTDMSINGWQIMALRSGQLANLDVSTKAVEAARRCLDAHASDGGAQYGYERGSPPKLPLTAAGLLCRQYTGWGARNPDLHRGCKLLLGSPPPAKVSKRAPLGPLYYYYYATQVMHHMEGEYWSVWNPLMRDFLIETQEDKGHKTGSWNSANSDWGAAGGRIYTTSLAILTLEVYYRHLPLYRKHTIQRQPELEKPAPGGAIMKDEMKRDKEPEKKKEPPKK